MIDVVVRSIDENTICKESLTQKGNARLARESFALKALDESPYTPKLISHSDNGETVSIKMSMVYGQSAKEWLNFEDEYDITPISWHKAKKRLLQYAITEMDLLGRNAIYRDMNLAHLIFSEDKASLVDHEATIINSGESEWRQDDFTGTWETMAPEEFPEHTVLSSRTATYRFAIFAHLVLAGKLPFARDRHSRSKAYQWRRTHSPRIDVAFSRPVRKVFMSALSIKKDTRHIDPMSFFLAVEQAYELSK